MAHIFGRIRALALAAALALVGVSMLPGETHAGSIHKKSATKPMKKSGVPSKRKFARAAPVADFTRDGEPNLQSVAALVFDQRDGKSLFEKNANLTHPIASITKLMTAMVVLDAKQSLEEPLTVTEDDVDILKNSRSRLAVGAQVRRGDMLWLALMASENRAASALARGFPGGSAAFVVKMNEKARALGLNNTRFMDSTGLDSGNISTPADLAKLVSEAYGYDKIREYSTSNGLMLTFPDSGASSVFLNTNPLVKNDDWKIGLSKTGFIRESGKCLVMQARIAERPVIIVLLDAAGRYTRMGDAQRIKKWIEAGLLRTRSS